MNLSPDSSADREPVVPEAVRLLVIEDDPDQQELIRETLEDHFGVGCVDAAETVAAALRQAFCEYDLILCDLNLPDGNGLIAAGRRPRRVRRAGDDADGRERQRHRQGRHPPRGHGLRGQGRRIPDDDPADGGEEHRRRADAAGAVGGGPRSSSGRRQLEQNLRHAEELASTDAMTGCYNRRAFEAIFAQHFAESARSEGDLTCVMVDLDKFKQVNDTLGHAVGDELIKTAARAIRGNLRRMDVACRFGGDEFVLLLPGADAADAMQVAQRIRQDYALGSAALLERRAADDEHRRGLAARGPADAEARRRS